jgi:hypothetical protein
VLDHLIAEHPDAIPLLPVSEDGLAASLARLDDTERRWVESTRYLGEAGPG